MDGSRLGLVLGLLCLGPLPSGCRNAVAEPVGQAEQQSGERLVQPNSGESQMPRTVMMGASWAEYYRSMPELKKNSDFGVAGSISAIAPATKADAGWVYQMVTVSADRVVWNSTASFQVPAAVTFKQTGGTYQNITYVMDDDPLFKIGDQVVLFFRQYSPGLYRVSGGPTGRFHVTSAGVRAIVDDGVQVPAGTSVAGLVNL
jgi:hypothetical protein